MNKLYRMAVTADIHGNLSAFKACLDDIQKRNVDEIICLGDVIAKGAHNSECVRLVRQYCSTVLQGNCDEYFTRPVSSFESKREQDLVRGYQQTLNDEDIAYLSSLPFSCECMISGRLIRMFHAGPDSLTNYSSNTFYASLKEKLSMFEPSAYTVSQKRADVAVFGHVHVQMSGHLFNRTLISAGSVGNALDFFRKDEYDAKISNTVNAQYLIIEGIQSEKDGPFSIQFVQVPYDVRAELESSRDFFEYEDLAYELLKGNYRDHHKIRKVLLKDGIDIDLL